MRINQIAFVLCSLTLSLSSLAQVNDRSGDEDTLKVTQITVFGYNPTISSAKKIATTPTVIDTIVEKPAVDYQFERRQFETSYSPDTISPAKMKGEPIDPLYRAYVKGGAGNGINYLGDVYINTTRSRKADIGLEIHTRGSDGNISDVAPAPYNRTSAALNGKKFLKRHSIEASIGYDREQLQYYGFDDTNPFYFNTSQDAFKQVYTDIFAGATLKSFYSDSSMLNHTIDLDYDHFADKYRANTEHNVKLNGVLTRFFGRHLGELGVNLDMNTVNYLDSFQFDPIGTVEQDRFNLIAGINPKMISQYKKFGFKIGAIAQAEFRSNSSSVHLYPDLYANFNLIREILIPYAGLTGGLQRNSLRTMTETNPFLWTSTLALRNTNELYRAYLGVRGAFTKRLTFNLQGARYRQEDAPLFANYNASQYNQGENRFGENFFVPIYDTMDVVQVSAEVMYRKEEKFQIGGRGVYRSFTTETEFEAWQRPALEIGLTGQYHLRHKIIATASANLLIDQWSKSYDTTATKFFGVDVYGNRLDPILDFNIGVEYRYTEQLSVFLNANNLIAQRYQRWNQYPNQRINVLGGITYSFWRD